MSITISAVIPTIIDGVEFAPVEHIWHGFCLRKNHIFGVTKNRYFVTACKRGENPKYVHVYTLDMAEGATWQSRYLQESSAIVKAALAFKLEHKIGNVGTNLPKFSDPSTTIIDRQKRRDAALANSPQAAAWQYPKMRQSHGYTKTGARPRGAGTGAHYSYVQHSDGTLTPMPYQKAFDAKTGPEEFLAVCNSITNS